MSGPMGDERAVTVILPLPPPECWPNRAGRLADRMAAKKAARLAATWAARLAVNRALPCPPAWPRVTATARYTFNVRRVRDDDSLMLALKAYRDGIASVVCAGGVDDGWRWARIEATVDRMAVEGVTITVAPMTTAEGE